MESFERSKQIIEVLENNNGYSTIDVLVKECNVSSMTIRRDLDKLQSDGIVEKRHGGAILNRFLHREEPYINKQNMNKNIKESIAEEAIRLVNDNDIIVLDAGTTTLAIARLIKTKKNITVITSDTYIAIYLSRLNLKVCMAGGFIDNSTGCASSTFTIDFLKNLNVDIAFIGVSSINKNFDCMASNSDRAGIKKAMLDISSKSVLVADGSKFGISSFCKIASIKDFSHLITNYDFSLDDKALIEHENCSIIKI